MTEHVLTSNLLLFPDTPQDSQSFAERILIEQEFGFEPAFNSLIMNKADGSYALDISRDNAFNKRSILDLMSVCTKYHGGKDAVYGSVCGILCVADVSGSDGFLSIDKCNEWV